MSENSALRTLMHFVAEDLGVADKWKDRNPVQLTTDIRKSIATRDARIAELEAALRVINALRRRIHFIEKHNQHFERCESAWCNPSPDEDPARECLDAMLAQARREGIDMAINHLEKSDCPIPIDRLPPGQTKRQFSNTVIEFLILELRQMAREVKP